MSGRITNRIGFIFSIMFALLILGMIALFGYTIYRIAKTLEEKARANESVPIFNHTPANVERIPEGLELPENGKG